MNLILLSELYKQSFITVPHQPTSGFDARTEDTVFVPEKFAELIVEECLKVCDNTRKLTWTVPLKDDEQITAVVCMIKKHFGVEE